MDGSQAKGLLDSTSCAINVTSFCAISTVTAIQPPSAGIPVRIAPYVLIFNRNSTQPLPTLLARLVHGALASLALSGDTIFPAEITRVCKFLQDYPAVIQARQQAALESVAEAPWARVLVTLPGDTTIVTNELLLLCLGGPAALCARFPALAPTFSTSLAEPASELIADILTANNAYALACTAEHALNVAVMAHETAGKRLGKAVSAAAIAAAETTFMTAVERVFQATEQIMKQLTAIFHRFPRTYSSS
jgi:hypothetical protein